MSCPARKFLAAGHIVSFQIHPNKKRARTVQKPPGAFLRVFPDPFDGEFRKPAGGRAGCIRGGGQRDRAAGGRIDLAFTTLPARPGCSCVPLYEDALAAVLPKGHPLAAGPVCPVEELAKEPFISLLESSNHDVRRAFRALSVRPNIRFETKDDYAVIAMVRQGLGVSIMPSLLLRGNTDGVEIRPIDPPASRTIALAVATNAPAAARFADFAARWVRENT